MAILGNKKKIVIFNGGRGSKAIIQKLLQENYHVFSILNAYDDGKSTGYLRENLDILGPSDIRKTHEIALQGGNTEQQKIFNLFQIRYEEKSLSSILIETQSKLKAMNMTNLLPEKGVRKLTDIFGSNTTKTISDMSLANLIYAVQILNCDRQTQLAIDNIERIIDLKQLKIILNSEENVYLHGLRVDGTYLKSEASIVEGRSNYNIIDIRFSPSKQNLEEQLYRYDQIQAFKKLNETVSLNKNFDWSEITDAGLIIYGAGTQHSSLYPTYLTRELYSIIKNIKCKKVLLTNIGADYETPAFCADDYVQNFKRYWSKTVATEKFVLADILTHVFINIDFKSQVLPWIGKEENNISYHFEKLRGADGRHNTDKIWQLLTQ